MHSKLVVTYNTSFDDITSDDDFDKIQVLSSTVETDEFFVAPIEFYNEEELDELDRKEKERKRVAHIVVLVSFFLFMISVTLVAVSLYMSKDIDELVRNSNEMLKKHNDRMSELHLSDVTSNVTQSGIL